MIHIIFMLMFDICLFFLTEPADHLRAQAFRPVHAILFVTCVYIQGKRKKDKEKEMLSGRRVINNIADEVFKKKV